MSFDKLIDNIKSELKAQRITNTVTFGNISDVDIDKTTIFPLAHFLTPSVSFNGSTNEFEVRILFLDIVDKDNKFENSFQGNNDIHDILNTQLVAANYISNSIRRGALSNSGYQVTGDPSAEMIIDQYENLLAGWGVTFSVVAKSEDTTCIDRLKSEPRFNTLIGGLGYTVKTAADLETLLQLTPGFITDFELQGNDIQAKMSGSYSLQNNEFISNNDITSFIDEEGLLTSIGDSVFRSTPVFNEFKGDACESIGNYAFYTTALTKLSLPAVTSTGNLCAGNSKGLNYIYLPLITGSIGTTATNNNCFINNRQGMTLVTSAEMQTNNGTAPDGDVQYVTDTLNGTVIYV